MQKRISNLPFHDTPEQAQKLDAVIEELKGQPGAVMPALHQAQDIYGYLPMEVQEKIAKGLDVPLEEVFGVSTFYSQFSLTPKGRNHISVCLGTACYVKGADKVLERITQKLGIQPEECTEDGAFSLTACRCIGACGLAPVMTVNDDVYGRLVPEDVDGILAKYLAASLITITVVEDQPGDTLSISVEDNGKGMSEETVKKVIDPFYTTRTTRSVGLGVPLFKMEAEMTGGSFTIQSQLGVGTNLTAVFKPSSVDMIPLGDINGTVQLLVSCNPQLDFIFHRVLLTDRGERREFALKTEELRQVLGEDVPLDTPDVVLWIKEYLAEQTAELTQGALPET